MWVMRVLHLLRVSVNGVGFPWKCLGAFSFQILTSLCRPENVREIYPLAAVRHHRKSAQKELGSLEKRTIFSNISSEAS